MLSQARPRLRAVEVKRLRQHGRWYFHMRDHLALAGTELLVPQELAPVLSQFDGQRDLAVIRAEALLRSGLAMTPAELVELVRQLDDALLLEGERVEAAKRAALAAYRGAPFRSPALAGRVYPAEASELRSHLRAFEINAPSAPATADSVAGVLSPHIDFARGGAVYARGWQQATAAARAAERVILLGTDHCGSGASITLTRQRYATPLGAFAMDIELQQALEAALGPDRAFAEELDHRSEHSIELAATWLHHVRGGEPVRLVPVLCGHPAPFLAAGIPGGDAALAVFLGVLREAVAGGALVVVAGDFAHVGPAFGDELPFGERDREVLRAADMTLVDACAEGAGAVLGAVGAIGDRYRICGLSPLALALAIMPPVKLDLVDYAHCPADEAGESFVSIGAGCFLRR